MSLNQQKLSGEKVLKENIVRLQQLIGGLGDDPSDFVCGKNGIYNWVKTLSDNPLKAPGTNVIKAIEADSVLKKPVFNHTQLIRKNPYFFPKNFIAISY